MTPSLFLSILHVVEATMDKLTLHMERKKNGVLHPVRITVGEAAIPVQAVTFEYTAPDSIGAATIRVSMHRCDIQISEEMEDATATDIPDL